MRKVILLIFLYPTIVSVAQDKEFEVLITDRPDQTESAAIVPAGHWQIETGILIWWSKICSWMLLPVWSYLKFHQIFLSMPD